MAAQNTDKVTDTRNAARPNSARATGTRSSGGTSLACDNLAGWPTASKVHFVTYQIDSNSAQVAGTQLDCSGIVSGNTIGSITVIDGTDTGNSVNDVVEMIPTAAWGQDLSDALTNQHSRTGTHTVITATSIATTGNSTIGGNEIVAGTLGVTGATTLTGAVGGAGYDVKTIANSYKFSVYRNAAWTDGNAAYALVTFDTKTHDTGANYSTSTGKFTAPVAGFYYFSATTSSLIATANVYQVALYVNGIEAKTGSSAINSLGSSFNLYRNVAGEVQLAANDYVQVYSYGTAGAGLTGASKTYFDGFLVSQS